MRDFPTRTSRGIFFHETGTYSIFKIFIPVVLGRKCDDRKCHGVLCDTIVNFGESLPEGKMTSESNKAQSLLCSLTSLLAELIQAFQEGEKADICLAMGSSLTVTPAADIPRVGEEKESDSA